MTAAILFGDSADDSTPLCTPLCSLYALAEKSPFSSTAPEHIRDPEEMEMESLELSATSAPTTPPCGPSVPAIRAAYPQRRLARAATAPFQGAPNGAPTPPIGTRRTVGIGNRRPPPLLVKKSSKDMTSQEDHVCAGYVLGRVLGQGSCSRVYAASGPRGSVAVKRMHEGGQDFEHILKNEFQILRSLNHPSIIRVF
jgi:hypothetical protein